MYTIGHSTRTIDEFLRLLKEHGVEILVDVRSWPTSRRSPHFKRASLEASLREEGIRYAWLGGSLGGYREEGFGEASPNKGWESGGFRKYADHALSEEFRRGLEEVLRLAEGVGRQDRVAQAHRFRGRQRRGPRLSSPIRFARESSVRKEPGLVGGGTRVHLLEFFRPCRNDRGPLWSPWGGEDIDS